MNLKAINTLCDAWAGFSDDYFIGDDGNMYRRLKSGYCRSKDYPYQQVRGQFGTEKQHTVKLHKAVALAFLPKPDGATDIDHINADKSDNRAENLQWLTHRENVQKRYADERRSI